MTRYAARSVRPRLHDTTCGGQPVVKPCIQAFNRLSSLFQTGLTAGCIVYTAGC